MNKTVQYLVPVSSIRAVLRVFLFGSLMFAHSSCFIIKPVEFSGVDHFDVKSGGDRMEIRFDLLLTNPNNYSLQVKDLHCRLELSDSLIGTLHTLQDARITRKEVVRLPLSFYPDMTNISRLIFSGDRMFKMKDTGKGLEIEGEMKMRKFIFTRRVRWSESIRF